MNIKLCVLALLFSSAAVCAQPLGLKGFHLGDEMKGCPNGAPVSRVLTGISMCSISVDTLAGQPVLEFLVGFHDERVVSIWATVQGGSAAATALRNALAEVYGQPTVDKSHINEYVWRRPVRKGMSVSGNKYSQRTTILVADAEAHERIQKQSAQKNKGDL